MTIRVYLRPTVQDHRDFNKYLNIEKGRTLPVYSFDHGGLTKEGDFFVLTINTLGGKVPEALLPYVEMVTLRTEFDCGAMRELGIYEQDNCEAELTKDLRGGVFMYVLNVIGKTVRDVINCYQTIRAGFILPVKNYVAKQSLPDPLANLIEAMKRVQEDPEALRIYEESMRQVSEESMLQFREEDELTLDEIEAEMKILLPVEPQDWFDLWMVIAVFLMNRPLMKKISTGWRKVCAWHVVNTNLATCSWLGLCIVVAEVVIFLAAVSWISLLLCPEIDQRIFLRDHPNLSWMLFQ